VVGLVQEPHMNMEVDLDKGLGWSKKVDFVRMGRCVE
jgi:hypothetical protein